MHLGLHLWRPCRQNLVGQSRGKVLCKASSSFKARGVADSWGPTDRYPELRVGPKHPISNVPKFNGNGLREMWAEATQAADGARVVCDNGQMVRDCLCQMKPSENIIAWLRGPTS